MAKAFGTTRRSKEKHEGRSIRCTAWNRIKRAAKPVTQIAVLLISQLLLNAYVVAALAQMLGPRGRRWLSKKLGNDRVFLDFDAHARERYEDRAQHALGVTDET